MPQDIRETELYRWAQDYYERTLTPGFGSTSNGIEPDVNRVDGRVAFTATSMSELEGVAESRIALWADGQLSTISTGPGDRLPRWTPDGTTLTFLSDRAERGLHQLFVLRDGLGEAAAAAPVAGAVEYHSISPDSQRVLLGVAEAGAELAGGQGSGRIGAAEKAEVPSWMPEVHEPTEEGWRRLWLHDLNSGSTQPMSREGLNVWEAAWCGNDTIVAVVSPGPSEELWYTAELVLIDVATGKERTLAETSVQWGLPVATLSGTRVAIAEAVCSDRWIVAGDVSVIELDSGQRTQVDTFRTDVTWQAWRDETTLVWLGQRGLDTVLGEHDVTTGTSRELWSSNETTGARYPEAALTPHGVVGIVHSALRPPVLATITASGVEVLADLAHDGSRLIAKLSERTTRYTWTAPDGLEIEGLLTLPEGEGPFPLMLYVHGGPVWAYRDTFGLGYHYLPPLVERGWAILRPNPRGSSGRGQEFARKVFGDMGGDDTQDYLSGVDQLVADGIADPQRLTVSGGSYGGYISCWLITQTDRFAASVPVAEVSNWVNQHYMSNIPLFDSLFLGSEPEQLGGNHFLRSPLFLADKVTTPSLHVCGDADRCTPWTQAMEFHHALLEAGAHSELVIYPGEGHGVRRFPACIDLLARTVEFIERYTR